MTIHLLSLALAAVTYLAYVATSATGWHRLGLVGPASQPLDVLRGLCASLVLTAHIVKTEALFEQGSPFAFGPDLYYTVEFGTIGVTVFFLITGYLFWGDAYPGQRQGRDTARWFLRRRWQRLAPAFLFVAGISFVFHLAYLHHTGQPVGVGTVVESWGRLFSFGAFIGDLPESNRFLFHAIGMSWSLAYEWVFYLCVALCVAAGRRAGLPALILAWLVLAWLWTGAVNHYPALFLLGGLAYQCRRRAWLQVVAVVIPSYFVGGQPELVAAAIFVAFLQIRSLPAYLEPFATAGKMTYSFYLTHGVSLLLTYLALSSWVRPVGLGQMDMYLFGLAGAAFSGCVAALVYRQFEMPYFRRRASGPRPAEEVQSASSPT